MIKNAPVALAQPDNYDASQPDVGKHMQSTALWAMAAHQHGAYILWSMS